MSRSGWLLGIALLATSPALAQPAGPPAAALDAFNDEYQDLWGRLAPTVEAHLEQEARTQLLAVHEVTSTREVTIRKVRAVKAALGGGPGFLTARSDRLELALPLRGGWTLEVDVDVRVRQKIGPWWATVGVPVRLIVDRIRLQSAVDLDASDPTHPVIRRLGTPQVDLRVRLRSRGFLYDVLFRLLSPIADRLAREAVTDALQGLTPSLSGHQGSPGPVPGAGAAPYTDSARPVPFQAIAANVAAKARRDNMPHGTLLVARMDVPAHDDWETAYGPGGAGNAGQPVDFTDLGDSAIWTGHYLAAEALRYGETGEAEALDNVRHALSGIGRLLDVYGGTGLLARVAAPQSSRVGQRIQRWGPYRQATLGGETWIAEEHNVISRDQYCGVFFGLTVALERVHDPAVRAECAARLRMMLDYLVAHEWWVDEDRPAFSLGPQGKLPTFWRGTAGQRLAYLLAGERVAPGRYAADLQEAGRVTPLAWLGEWLNTFSLDGYYKFNLSHATYYDYFRLETDPSRRADLLRAFGIVRRYIGHHRNPHFDLVATSADPSLRAAMFPQVREALRRFVTRNHRAVAPAVVDLSGVQWVTVSMPVQNGSSITTQTTRMPAEPLDIPLQEPEEHFLWQRSPFKPAHPNQGDPRAEKPGIDLTLPYWLGRSEGAF